MGYPNPPRRPMLRECRAHLQEHIALQESAFDVAEPKDVQLLGRIDAALKRQGGEGGND